MSTTPCSFVWYELMTSDPQAAASFYQNVIGWSAKDAGMEVGPYTILSVGPTMVGGLMAIPPQAAAMGARPGWLGYIGVDDVDAYTDKVKAAGGTVFVPPTDIPGVGRFSSVTDSQGAVFMLFKGNGSPDQAQPAPGTPGTMGWRELHAGDGVSAFAFYSGLFGWIKTEAMDMGPMGVYQLFAAGGESIGGMMTKMPDCPMPFWLYYVNVDAIDAAMERVTQNGGKVVMGPMEVPGGQWILQCTDPQGAMFAMVAPKR